MDTMEMLPATVTKETIEAHPMNGGDGPNSYTHNSCYQRGVIDAAKGVIVDAITESLDIKNNPAAAGFDSSNPFRIADFGCSTGPNTYIAMQNVVEAVQLKYQSVVRPEPEFHVFFNDHTFNDFNTLFRSLPLSRQYFAAGVPGSFYSRLFPKASLHFVHSSYALHWLSSVPEEVQDISSPAWNKGKIHYTGSDKYVSKAYFAQFKKDMDKFLTARAEELVGGGLMVILMPGVPNGALFSQTGAGVLHALLASSLIDMANMGVIKEERVDSFNLPQYHPSTEELEILIEMNDSFSIEKIGMLSHPMKNLPFDVKMTSTQGRAVMEGLIKEHFGDEINLEQFFEIFTKKLEENYNVFDKEIFKDADLFIVLKRKSN